jgi:hypothetical protein
MIARGCSSVAEQRRSTLEAEVRFLSPAPLPAQRVGAHQPLWSQAEEIPLRKLKRHYPVGEEHVCFGGVACGK